jgi:hypothetical protein
MPVMSVRLSEEEFRRLRAVAEQEDKEKSSLARELLMNGLSYKMLLGYKEGKISLSTLSKGLGMSFSETLDFLAVFGLQAPLSYDDYLQGLQTARRVVR